MHVMQKCVAPTCTTILFAFMLYVERVKQHTGAHYAFCMCNNDVDRWRHIAPCKQTYSVQARTLHAPPLAGLPPL